MSGYGALRDALGSVQNLEHLLRSRNVAPRAISQVLPDVHACCEPLLSELAAFRDRISPGLEPNAVTALVDGLRDQVTALEIATALALKKQVNASSRLKLERQVIQVTRHFSGALPLAELLAEARQPRVAPVDFRELLELSRREDQPHTPGARQITARLRSMVTEAPIYGSPRLVLGLVGILGSGLNSDNETPRVGVILSEPSRGVYSAEMVTTELEGIGFPLRLPPSLAISASCAVAAASSVGIHCEMQPGATRLTWAA
ncbi:MAG: hypothetical protein RJA70_3574 [Pseudomonadota bacterium]